MYPTRLEVRIQRDENGVHYLYQTTATPHKPIMHFIPNTNQPGWAFITFNATEQLASILEVSVSELEYYLTHLQEEQVTHLYYGTGRNLVIENVPLPVLRRGLYIKVALAVHFHIVIMDNVVEIVAPKDEFFKMLQNLNGGQTDDIQS